MSEPISFTKMQGAGNDFIVIDNRVSLYSPEQIVALAPKLCDRRFGIGADGILLLEQSNDPALDYTMFYRNADGSDAGMCGNGARCLALYASDLGLGEELAFDVHGHVYEALINTDRETVSIAFPMHVQIEEVTVDEETTVLKVPAGTEHIVWEVPAQRLSEDDILRDEGRRLRHHDLFNPPGTNVNFISGSSETALRLQTYERGVEDLTLACGTGAIASALSWHHLQQGSESGEQTMAVETKGGALEVSFSYDANTKSYEAIRLSGPAAFVFTGTYHG